MVRGNGVGLRRAILDVARRILLQDGYTSLSMRRIAAEVGCTPTSIYLYFDNKDALIHALIDEGMEKLGAELGQALEGTEDPLQQLGRLCRRYLEFGLQNPEYYEVMFMLHPKHMRRYPAEKYRRARRNLEPFAEAVRAVRARTGLPAPQPDYLASLIWTSLHGTVSLLIAERVDASMDRAALVQQAAAHAARMACAPAKTDSNGTEQA